LKIFDLENPDMALFETFGNKIKEKIQSTPEWNKKITPSSKLSSQSSGFDDMADDVPF
jgi:hypothetical protein